MPTLHDALCTAIETSDRSRYRIAHDSGVSESQLSRFINGKSGLSIDNAERITKCLGLEIVLRPKRRARKAK